jgi:hypothetical protein
MQRLLNEYLSGKLASTGTPHLGKVTITNHLGIAIQAGLLLPDGAVYPRLQVNPGEAKVGLQQPINWYYVLWGLDGSLAAVFGGVQPPQDLSIRIGPAELSSPGDIGPVPTPSTDILIPNDSPSILVACAKGKTASNEDTYMTRSQFWKRSGDSMSLAPTETVTTSYTSTTGIQETSSDTKTVATSLNASASAGWGPVSASISAALNTSHTSFQQYVSTQTDSQFESRTYNPHPTDTRMILRWQLYDAVTIFSAKDKKVLAQVTTAQHPDVVKVYKEAELKPSTRAGKELTDSERRELSDLLAELQSEPTPLHPAPASIDA